ncbi:MAG: hypothetical protein ACRD2U_17315 [Terriglobales bacterium]
MESVSRGSAGTSGHRNFAKAVVIFAACGVFLGHNDNADWIPLYQDALIETDLSILPAKIELAANAVQASLERFAHDSRERDVLLDALRTLQALRRETR